MVRLADSQNKTVLLQKPAEDVNYDFLQLERMAPKRESWILAQSQRRGRRLAHRIRSIARLKPNSSR